MRYDSIIIGGGPAGIAAAIQLKRMGYTVLLLEKRMLGGLLNNAELVENYPGFPKGVGGKKLVGRMVGHLKAQNIKWAHDEVRAIKKKKYGYSVHTRTAAYTARAVIVATGTVPKKTAINGSIPKQDIFYEVVDLPPIKNRMVSIIGSGDVAFDYALTCAKHARVEIYARHKVRALPLLKKRAGAHPHITMCAKNRIPKGDYLLVAIGRKANRQLIRSQPAHKLERNGLFLAGDARRPRFRHTGIAVGDGICAALKVGRFLDAHGT